MNEDKKLSTKKRNSLPESTFCGPGRSFPVPDCVHVSAALRFLGRAKVSESTKAKIRACVMRKSRNLGCPATSRDSEELLDKIIDSEEYKDTRELVEYLEELNSDIGTDQIERLKERAKIVLSILRHQPLEDADINYGQRSFESLLDSIFDSISDS